MDAPAGAVGCCSRRTGKRAAIWYPDAVGLEKLDLVVGGYSTVAGDIGDRKAASAWAKPGLGVGSGDVQGLNAVGTRPRSGGGAWCRKSLGSQCA